MQGLTLKHLRYFEALAQHRHFGRAADACAISQPALSMQIRDLEEMLGTPLVERGYREVRMTQFADIFVERARDILRSVDELGDLARASRERLVGRLRIGVIPTIAPYLLPSIIENLTRTYEGLDIHVRETLTPRLLEELSDGRIDTAIVALPISEPSLTEIPLFEERFVLVRPDSEACAPVPNAEGLREMRLLLLEEGHCFRDQALSFCSMQTVRPWEGLDGSSLSTLVQMVGMGLGITLLPEMAVDVEAQSAAVDVANFAEPQPSRTIGIIWRKTSPLSDQLMQIAELVRDAGKQRRTSQTGTA